MCIRDSLYALPDAFLIVVKHRGIDAPVSGLHRVFDTTRCLLIVFHQPRSQPNRRNLNAIFQLKIWYHTVFLLVFCSLTSKATELCY